MGTLLGLSILLSVVSAPFNMFAADNANNSANVSLQQANQVENPAVKFGPEPIVAKAASRQDIRSSLNSGPELNAIGEFKITAYSSTPDQTDDSPFIMASGKHVYDGAVASNFLPLGTKVRFPELYGDKVFVVEDRMNRRFQDRIDIWMPTRSEALTFGMRYASVEVLK